MRRPTFLVLGAAKSGTTSLCLLLEQHPDVYLSEPKEPTFFEWFYERGIEYYIRTYYPGWGTERAAGEGRVYNLYLPYVAPRIRKALPDARLIIILRDPVHRAHSHWWHRVTRGYENRSFDDSVRQELKRLAAGKPFPLKDTEELWRRNFHPGSQRLHTADLRHVPYIELGHYADQAARYLDIFPREQMRLLLLDDLRVDRDRVVRETWKFLGVCSEREVADLPPLNVALEEIKSGLAFRLERLSWTLGINQRVPKWAKSIARRLIPGGRKRIFQPDLSHATRALLAEHYAPHNERLAQLLNRDLSGWSGGAGSG